MYMREYWVQVQKSPVVYRYIYWSITVPLQMIEFNLILKAARGTVCSMMFWRLLGGTVAMLASGTLVRSVPSMLGLALPLACRGELSFSSSSSRPATHRQNAQTPSGRLSTTCALSSLLDGPSIPLATYLAHSPVLRILSSSMCSNKWPTS